LLAACFYCVWGRLFCFFGSSMRGGGGGRRRSCAVSVDRLVRQGYFKATSCKGSKGWQQALQIKSNYSRSSGNLSHGGCDDSEASWRSLFRAGSALFTPLGLDRGKAKITGFFLFSLSQFLPRTISEEKGIHDFQLYFPLYTVP
jgi:hypothetical protein